MRWMLLAAVAGGTDARALDLSVPRLQDLRPKWQALEFGTTEAVALQLMGEPNHRTETHAFGLVRLTLEWKDINGRHYRVKFVAGRLVAKSLSDTG